MQFLHQTSDAMFQEPAFPPRNRRRGGIEQILNLLISHAIGQQQDHARSHHIARRKTPRLRHLLEFVSLLFCED